MTAENYVSTPTIAPIRQVVSVPDTIDFRPSELISSRRCGAMVPRPPIMMPRLPKRSEEHTSELQSLTNLVCRLLLEKKKKQKRAHTNTKKQQRIRADTPQT